MNAEGFQPLGYKLAEVSDRLVDELAEVRRELADLSKEMAEVMRARCEPQ